MTASQLLAALRSAGVSLEVDGCELVVGDVPKSLKPALSILHTGVRAALTGSKWWACWSESPRIEEISPHALIPNGVTLLSVEGDGSAGGKWDRIRPDAHLDHPELFQGAAVAKNATPKSENATAGPIAAA